MSDIKIFWDTPNGRGDWSFLPFQSNDVPVNVVTPVPVGVGDNVTNTFQLLTPDAQIAPISQANIYRQDWQGNQLLYPTARTNIAQQSQTFATSSWTASNMLVTQNVAATTAPDGSGTAAKLADNDSVNSFKNIENSHNSGVSAAQTLTYSIFAKAADRSILLLRLISLGNTSNYGYAYFDLSAGTVGSMGNVGAATGITATITPVGNGWYRCRITCQPDPSATGIGFFVGAPLSVGGSTGYVGVAGNGIYIWGAQVETGAVLTSYIPTTSAAVTVTDYVLSSLGLVALATPPVMGAQLSWTGQYVDQQSSGGYLETGDDLETAILFSLFTDGEAASDDQIPDGSSDRRGWWGDDGNDDGLGGTGSRLWLLARRTSPTDQTLQDAYDYIAQAIQWLVDTGVVARFDINVQWTRANMIGASIVAWPPGGGAPQTYNWAWGAN